MSSARILEPLADDLVRAAPSVGTFRRSSSAIADPLECSVKTALQSPGSRAVT